MSHHTDAREMLNRVRFAAAQSAYDNAAPPDDEPDEIAERRAQIEEAQLALIAAESMLNQGRLLTCDGLMADACNWLLQP